LSLLAQLTAFLLAMVVAVPLFRRLKLSAVLAYLAAGAALGPWGLGVFQDVEGTLHVAELGVVLLLFVIGLELRPARLRVLRRVAQGLGLTQLLVTQAVFTALGIALGVDPIAAAVAGFALSLSSTPLVLQLLAERGELSSPAGRSAFAVLLLQDAAVMPVLALLPLLGASEAPVAWTERALAIGRALGALALLIVGGRMILRPTLRAVAATHVGEAFTAVSLLIVVGTALIASAAGLSMALGAFIAGVLLADSEYRHEIEADLEPFKGLLLGLFFGAVGASAHLPLLAEQPWTVLGLSLGIVTVKSLLLFGIARGLGHAPGTARSLGVALCQAGEFGFVIFQVAVTGGILSRSGSDLLVLGVTGSMVASPLLMLAASAVERWLEPAAPAFEVVPDHRDPVLIAGFGRFGQIIGRVLRARRIGFTALDLAVSKVDTLRRFGSRVYYGDASRLDLLRSAGAQNATALVIAIEDGDVSLRIAELARRHFPHLRLLARARNRQHALALMETGVDHIIRDTYLSSLELSRHVLESVGISPSEAQHVVTLFRERDEETLREQLAFKDDEQKLIQTAELAARELERLLQADTERSL
jgi:glutathione-regulated potassium-efflux system ancillary protein KefC/glutathione-regulated potassium-efflux system protein KefB